METEITQEELSPEEAKAALGLSTRLSEQYLMSQAEMEAQMMGGEAQQEGVEGQETPEMALQGDVQPESEEKPVEDNSAQIEGKMDEKLEILRTELKDTLKLEIESIRADIKSALENEED